MTKLDELHHKWMKETAYKRAYEALEEEFALASALLNARDAAHMTQEDVAKAMGTTQTVIARLESGRTMPSTRTLLRFARATGMRLRISFEPEQPASGRLGRFGGRTSRAKRGAAIKGSRA